jgi:HJR/Mrr/RecB family endonuclease
MPSGGFDDQEQSLERHQSATLPPDGDIGVDALAAGLLEIDTLDRLSFHRASKPLQELAKTSTYAASKLKEVQKAFFGRIQNAAEQKGALEHDERELARLVDELLDATLLSDWFNRNLLKNYEGQLTKFATDLLNNSVKGETLASALEGHGLARTGYEMRYGAAKIKRAADQASRAFYQGVNQLVFFAREREASLLPNLRRELAMSTNKYGDPDLSRFLTEVSDFCAYSTHAMGISQIPPTIAIKVMSSYFVNRIEELKVTSVDESLMPEDGFEFEIWCAEQIQRQGWEIEATPKSGDQGVDIIVRRDGFTVAVQCKRYSSPIGNAAIQEVHAGRTFVGAKGAIVIGTGGFTKAARSIAAISKIELLDALDIGKFSETFGHQSKATTPEQSSTFISESYGQSEIVKMILKGLPLVGDLVSDEMRDRFNGSFNPETSLGRCEANQADAAALLATASIVLMSTVRLTGEVRLKLLAQEDLNKEFLSDTEVSEILTYQIYDAHHMEEVIQAFRQFVSEFSLQNMKFAFLEEFE